MRGAFDELWIIDLEGDNLGARKTENVFAIQTAVCIAVGVRYAEKSATSWPKCATAAFRARGKKSWPSLKKCGSFPIWRGRTASSGRKSLSCPSG